MRKQDLRKFGITLGIAFAIFSCILFLKHKHFFVPAACISISLVLTALIKPLLLNPVELAWLKLGYALSWINTRLILCVLFFFFVTPIGLIMRLFGRDILGKRIDKRKASYWKSKEHKEFKQTDYSRQF